MLHDVYLPQTWHAAKCVYCRLHECILSKDSVCGMLYLLRWQGMLHAIFTVLTEYAAYCIFCKDRVCYILYLLHWRGILHAVSPENTLYAACCIHCVDRVCCMLFLMLKLGMLHAAFTSIDRVCFILYLLLTHWILHTEYAACVINWKHIAWCMLYLVHMLHGEVCHCRQCFNFFSLFLPGFQVGQEYTRSIPRWIDTNRMSSTIGGNADCVHSQFSCIYVISVNSVLCVCQNYKLQW